jgi:uncharacterized surface protein with fasciclin (FAS1) repeats
MEKNDDHCFQLTVQNLENGDVYSLHKVSLSKICLIEKGYTYSLEVLHSNTDHKPRKTIKFSQYYILDRIVPPPEDINIHLNIVSKKFVLDRTVGSFFTLFNSPQIGTFEILYKALEKADLISALGGTGPFTVFAPTDAAFEAYIIENGLTAAELLDSNKLLDILTYHVVAGNVMSSDLTTNSKVSTLQGAELSINIKDSVMINDANVTAADIIASNGVVHVIDKVLDPPPWSICEKDVVCCQPDCGLILPDCSAAGCCKPFENTKAACDKCIATSKCRQPPKCDSDCCRSDCGENFPDCSAHGCCTPFLSTQASCDKCMSIAKCKPTPAPYPPPKCDSSCCLSDCGLRFPDCSAHGCCTPFLSTKTACDKCMDDFKGKPGGGGGFCPPKKVTAAGGCASLISSSEVNCSDYYEEQHNQHLTRYYTCKSVGVYQSCQMFALCDPGNRPTPAPYRITYACEGNTQHGTGGGCIPVSRPDEYGFPTLADCSKACLPTCVKNTANCTPDGSACCTPGYKCTGNQFAHQCHPPLPPTPSPPTPSPPTPSPPTPSPPPCESGVECCAADCSTKWPKCVSVGCCAPYINTKTLCDKCTQMTGCKPAS